jgi:dipeptidyl-peptidase-4
MGLLAENEAGYRASSAVENASKLKGYLLLVHSGLDENVHPQQTMQLLTALLEAGKDAELRFFPPGAHGAAFDTQSYLTMLKVYANTWCEHVATRCTPVNLNEGKEPKF